ncbi:MAG: class I SAM-dependent methyltransferase [Desulfohalobiaceae bacterium]|nr:class I SAM-dependent methyltransferase [Desulfohalobiaceae bacterium]
MDLSEYHKIHDLEDRHWWYQTTHRRVIRELKLLPPPGLILDAGCGTGGLSRLIGESYRVLGFDASPEAVYLASQRTRFAGRIVSAGIESIPFKDCCFDAVTCIDVLYHNLVQDDLWALKELNRVLNPGGYLIVQVPAFECLRGGHDEAVHTRKRYTAGEMSSLLFQSGFSPVKVTYRYPWLFGPAFIIRRLSRGSAKSDLHPTTQGWNRLAQHIASFFENSFPRAPFGTSLLSVAQKKDY